MSKIIILADASSIHTQKWASYLSDFFEITVLSLLPHHSDKYNIILIPSKSYKARKNNFEYNRTKVLFESISFIRKQLRIIKPDLLHAHFASSYGLMGALTGFENFLVSVWGYDILIFPKKSFLHKSLIKYVLKKSNAVLATSQYLAKETNNFTTKEIYHTPFGVDTNIFIPLKKENKDIYIIGITKTLRVYYGYIVLFEAIQKFAEFVQNFEVHIIGDGEDRALIQKRCKELTNEKKVKFFGEIKHIEITKYIHKFDVAVYPSTIYESFGVSAVEVAACGIPLIVSDLGGLTEIVEDGVNGFTIQPGNSEQLFQKLLYLYQNPIEAKSMGKKGRAIVLEKFNWEDNAQNLVNIYRSFIK